MITRLHIQTAVRDEITFLKNVYCTTPLKVANITEDKKSPLLELMIMSSSPGILDGDEYDIKVELSKGCMVRLQTQSYQRLFNMKSGATQVTSFHLSENSFLHYIPYPSVPHASSIFSAVNRFFLERNCTLLFGEILTCGRKLNGEVFTLEKYHNLTEIFIENKLVIKENLLIEPKNIDVNKIGQLEGYTHQASLIFLHETIDSKELNSAITILLETEKDICFGISATPINGILVRILGQKGEQLFEILKRIALYLQSNYVNTKLEYAN